MPSPALIIRKTLIKLTIPFLLNTLISVECLVQCSVPQAALNRKPTNLMWGKMSCCCAELQAKYLINSLQLNRQTLITDTPLKYIYYLLNNSMK